jgi:[acyl-carrier-protein] S-malonyltransferase
VVSGDVDACDRLEALAREEKICGTVRLAVAGAFHSERMRPAAIGLKRALAAVEIREPQAPFYSNVTADRVRDPDEIRRLLAEQLTKPVLWQATMERALALGIDAFEEIGPGRVLAGILKKIDRNASVSCFNSAQSISEGLTR